MADGTDEPSESQGESEGAADAAREEPTSQTEDAEARERAKAEIDALLAQLKASATRTTPPRRPRPLVEPLRALPRTNDYLERLDREQDIKLKRRYARVLLWLLGGQLAVADGVFIAYAQVGAHWRLSSAVIDVWLGATLIEVVGIVLVVTRYLFPRRDTQP